MLTEFPWSWKSDPKYYTGCKFLNILTKKLLSHHNINAKVWIDRCLLGTSSRQSTEIGLKFCIHVVLILVTTKTLSTYYHINQVPCDRLSHFNFSIETTRVKLRALKPFE